MQPKSFKYDDKGNTIVTYSEDKEEVIRSHMTRPIAEYLNSIYMYNGGTIAISVNDVMEKFPEFSEYNLGAIFLSLRIECFKKGKLIKIVPIVNSKDREHIITKKEQIFIIEGE